MSKWQEFFKGFPSSLQINGHQQFCLFTTGLKIQVLGGNPLIGMSHKTGAWLKESTEPQQPQQTVSKKRTGKYLKEFRVLLPRAGAVGDGNPKQTNKQTTNKKQHLTSTRSFQVLGFRV